MMNMNYHCAVSHGFDNGIHEEKTHYINNLNNIPWEKAIAFALIRISTKAPGGYSVSENN